jgi:hypothetical protein
MVIGPGRLWARSRGLCRPFSFLRPIFRRVRFRSANRLSRSDGSDRRYAGKGWGFTSLGRFGQGECRRRTSSPNSPDSYGLVLRRRPRGLLPRLYLSCHILARCRWCWNNTDWFPLCARALALSGINCSRPSCIVRILFKASLKTSLVCSSAARRSAIKKWMRGVADSQV